MFLNSRKQQQNGMSQLCSKEPGILFALQRNQEWGNFPHIGLNIVLVPKPASPTALRNEGAHLHLVCTVSLQSFLFKNKWKFRKLNFTEQV